MRKSHLFFSLLLFCSCNLKNSPSKAIDEDLKLHTMIEIKDTISKLKDSISIEVVSGDKDILNDSKGSLQEKDTIISYNIYGLSSEGAEAIVTYKKGKIAKCLLNIYGETGQSNIIYNFIDNLVKIDNKIYKYKTDLYRAKDGMKLENEFNYILNSEGNSLNGQAAEKDIEVYKDLKKYIPFELREAKK